MKGNIKKRLAALETAREPKAAVWADYVRAAYSPNPGAAFSQLPRPIKGTLAYTIFTAFEKRKLAGALDA